MNKPETGKTLPSYTRRTGNEIKKHVKNTSIFTVVLLLKITGSIKDSVKVLGLAYLSRTEKLIFMISKIANAKIPWKILMRKF